MVLGVGASGGFLVQFDGYDAPEEVGKEAIELRPAEDEGGYKPVAAPKRRRVDDSAEVQEVPKWLQVKEGDDEKTKAKKRKLAKSYKSKVCCAAVVTAVLTILWACAFPSLALTSPHPDPGLAGPLRDATIPSRMQALCQAGPAWACSFTSTVTPPCLNQT